MKKILSIMLVCIMMLSLMAGCKKQEAQDNTQQATNPQGGGAQIEFASKESYYNNYLKEGNFIKVGESMKISYNKEMLSVVYGNDGTTRVDIKNDTNMLKYYAYTTGEQVLRVRTKNGEDTLQEVVIGEGATNEKVLETIRVTKFKDIIEKIWTTVTKVEYVNTANGLDHVRMYVDLSTWLTPEELELQRNKVETIHVYFDEATKQISYMRIEYAEKMIRIEFLPNEETAIDTNVKLEKLEKKNTEEILLNFFMASSNFDIAFA